MDGLGPAPDTRACRRASSTAVALDWVAHAIAGTDARFLLGKFRPLLGGGEPRYGDDSWAAACGVSPRLKSERKARGATAPAGTGRTPGRGARVRGFPGAADPSSEATSGTGAAMSTAAETAPELPTFPASTGRRRVARHGRGPHCVSTSATRPTSRRSRALGGESASPGWQPIRAESAGAEPPADGGAPGR